VRIAGNGQYRIERSTIAAGGREAALALATRSGSGAVSDSVIAGAPKAFTSATPERITIARSVLAGEAGAFTDGGANRRGAMTFAAGGAEPYVPAAGSLAVGLAEAGEGALDLLGRARKPHGGAAGAFEFLDGK
jgi:hypothetical protein